MTVPKPTGLTCRHQAAWAYITVPAERGTAQLVEYEDRGSWYAAAQMNTEWLVPMHQVGQTEFRARYERAGAQSAWTTGRVWMPTGFTVDDDPEPPRPQPPYRLRNRWPSTGAVELSWSQDGSVDGWRVVVTQNGHKCFEELVSESYVEVDDLLYDKPVEVAVRAVAGPIESEPLVQNYPDMHYRPSTPRDLRVVPSDTTLGLEWLQDDCCEQWQVLWRRADLGLIRFPDSDLTSGEGTGNVEVSGDPQYTITGLEPDTEYSLLVAALWRRSSYSEESLIAQHSTTGGGEGPRKPRLRAGRVTATSIEVLWDDDPAATEWWVRRKPGHSRHKPTGQPRWLAEALAPETSYEFGVIAVDGDHGLESEEATITITTTGDVPPPVGPSVPRNLRVHCIHATHAKAEWDANPIEEDVKYYQVRLSGASSSAADRIGTLQELTDLIPESDYTVEVRACNDTGCSGWASASFTTGSIAPPPEPDPPSDIPKPTGLYLDPVAPGVVEATWNRPADDRLWWLISADGLAHQQRVTQPHARLEVIPGAEATVEVYALLNGGQGEPTKLSPVASAGVVTARKGA